MKREMVEKALEYQYFPIASAQVNVALETDANNDIPQTE